jgi:UDPglucose 6-dehydrogenase
VIGESNPDDGQRLERVHRLMTDNKPTVRHLSLINAELAKVSLNAYITLKISFANSLANLCEQVPGANVDAVTETIGLDRRISPFYLKGGLSYGGTCFPRDTAAFVSIAAKYGCQSELLAATDSVNRLQDDLLAAKVMQLASSIDDCRVGILGMSFKPRTSVIVESPGIKLARRLLGQNLSVVVYDELAMQQVGAVFGSSILYAESALHCVQQCDLVVVAHLSRAFCEIVESYIPQKQKIILDCWRGIDPDKLAPLYCYVPIGKRAVLL